VTFIVRDLGVDHYRADVFMPQEFLVGADVAACLKQMSSEGMPGGVASGPFRQDWPHDRFSYTDSCS
jgi:hypothetical protein